MVRLRSTKNLTSQYILLGSNRGFFFDCLVFNTSASMKQLKAKHLLFPSYKQCPIKAQEVSEQRWLSCSPSQCPAQRMEWALPHGACAAGTALNTHSTLLYQISLSQNGALCYGVPLQKNTNLYLLRAAARTYYHVCLHYPPHNRELQFSNMSSLAPYACMSIYKHGDSKMFLYFYTSSSNCFTKQKFSWVNFCEKPNYQERKKGNQASMSGEEQAIITALTFAL